MTRMTIELTDKACRELEAAGKAEGMEAPQLAGKFLESYLAVRRLENVQRKLAPYAKAAGFETDEDVFKVVS